MTAKSRKLNNNAQKSHFMSTVCPCTVLARVISRSTSTVAVWTQIPFKLLLTRPQAAPGVPGVLKKPDFFTKKILSSFTKIGDAKSRKLNNNAQKSQAFHRLHVYSLPLYGSCSRHSNQQGTSREVVFMKF